MDAFGDQLSVHKLNEINVEKEKIFRFNEVKDVVNEMILKLEQMIENDINYEDKHDIKDTEEEVEVNDCEDVFVVNKEQIETKSDEVFNRLNVRTNKVLEDFYQERDEDLNVLDVKQKECIDLLITREESMTGFMKNEMKTIKSEKWGESLGIFDENGVQRRVIELNELNNYRKLDSNSIKNDFNYYLSLVNDRYPRFYDSTVDYFQRWRMRYNIFVNNVFESPDSELLLHIGEIHLYFDLIPRFSQPYYVNNSFYANTLPIETPVNEEILSRVRRTLDALRFGKDVSQLKFPIESQLFNNCNEVFDKFMERQNEFIEEAQIVHRKNLQKRRLMNSGRGRNGDQFNTHFRTFDRNDGNQREFTANERNFGRNEREFSAYDRNPVHFSNNRDMNRNERGFGRNNRGFDISRGSDRSNRGFDRSNRGFDNNRGFDRSYRGFDRNNRGFDRNSRGFEGNNRGFDRNNRGFGGNNRGFGGNNRDFEGNNRGFDGSHRGFGRGNRGVNRNNERFDRDLDQNRNVRDNRTDIGLDSDVTFEDTLERHERLESDTKLGPKRNAGFKRSNHNRGRGVRKSLTSGPNFGNNERTNYHNNSDDLEFDDNRRRNDDSFIERERRDFPTPFKSELNYNRNKQSFDETLSEENSRSNFANTYRQNRNEFTLTSGLMKN